MTAPSHARAALALVLALFLGAACSDSGKGGETPTAVETAAAPKAAATKGGDAAPLEAGRRELIEIAFRAATKLPLVPHVKDRARAQEKVVDTCLALDREDLALGFAKGIPNWRRGAALAAVALHRARRGETEGLESLLESAEKVAQENLADPDGQPWRSDRIRASIARALLLAGERARAAKIAATVGESEAGGIQADRIGELDDDAFKGELETLDTIFKSGSFDSVRSALEACVALHDRFYGRAERRAVLEERVKTSFTKLPLDLRIGFVCDLAENAIEHGEPAEGKRLAADATAVFETGNWHVEDHLEWIARFALLRHRSGETDAALTQARDGLAFYDSQYRSIVDIDRADALRALAESLHRMGDDETAARAYAKALEAGIQNPNSRPRADDLVATCLSMARWGFTPDDAMRDRIRAIEAELGTPW
ncbi:MAG: hypothetical protein R3F20_02600 [Planctomycetota bacterium]